MYNTLFPKFWNEKVVLLDPLNPFSDFHFLFLVICKKLQKITKKWRPEKFIQISLEPPNYSIIGVGRVVHNFSWHKLCGITQQKGVEWGGPEWRNGNKRVCHNRKACNYVDKTGVRKHNSTRPRVWNFSSILLHFVGNFLELFLKLFKSFFLKIFDEIFHKFFENFVGNFLGIY